MILIKWNEMVEKAMRDLIAKKVESSTGELTDSEKANEISCTIALLQRDIEDKEN